MYYITSKGDRPDLAKIDVNLPEEYIADKIMPIVPVADLSGDMYYRTQITDTAAQTNRVAGAAPATTRIANTEGSFRCAEVIKRGSFSEKEAKLMGGVDKAEIVATKFAKRSVCAAKEAAVATLVLGATATGSFDPAKLLTQGQTALQSIRKFGGKTSLVTSTATFKTMVQAAIGDSTFGSLFSRIVSGSSPSVAVSGMSLESWKAGMAMLLGIDQVLLGDDDVWNATAISGRYAFGKFDVGADEFSYKYEPIFGKTFMFLPDGNQPYNIIAIPDELNHDNHIDAQLWYNAVRMNADACVVFDGVQ